ncbi:hypothetical protein OMK64_06595 [Cellulomonas fimi]|uniref:zinc finger domain-containing protein n=1 Tax=Cellulomonas fimi TaxID=1708 RepID=UPI00234CFF4D|nr:hypothetical protein [Cellulomonas fimi]MDC7121200.1 hypothetical protein [Cellulomonas fimi]
MTDDLHTVALTVRCPRCDALPGKPCTSSEGQERGRPHRRRVELARTETATEA